MYLENILVALSNFPAYYPIMQAWDRGDHITAYAVLFVAVASFVSHLFESHKHGMTGFGTPAKWSYILNRIDVIGCGIVISRFGYLFWTGILKIPNMSTISWGFVSLSMMVVSEYDQYNPKLKWLYIPTHCMWHIMVFTLLNSLIS